MGELLIFKLLFLVLLLLLIYSGFAASAWWRSVFSDGAFGSLSRVLTAFNSIFALAWVTFIVYEKKELPAVDLLTLAAFVNSPYALNLAGKVGQTAVSKGVSEGETK